MRIGIVACNIMKMELEKALKDFEWSNDVVYLDAALHVNPEKMRERIVEEVEKIASDVDGVFLGYGFCQSLKGIEENCSVPVVLPQVDDCISLLMGPERYAQEVKKEVGTWFMTPGWAEIGAEMVIKELHLDRVVKYGRDPMDMARRVFQHYRRGLLVDTGVGDWEETVSQARKFCEDFNLDLEETRSNPVLLSEWLAKAPQLIAQL